MKSNSSGKIRVAVGMSGGVDSSVVAMLLKDAGYEVVGLFMKLWHDTSCNISRENACCDEQAMIDAKKVADQLGIQFYVVDARAPFRKAVTDYFIDEFASLRTPNPCIVCNKAIKFGWLLDFAKKIGCDYLATGHYARIKDSSKFPSTNYQLSTKSQFSNSNKLIENLEIDKLNGNWKLEIGNYHHLLKGVDSQKDQSYFLYQLSQEQLSQIMFPLGAMTKTEVRKIAKENNLPVYEKVESQEVCFVAENDYREFLKRHLPASYWKSGKIVDTRGFVIGKHDGLINYTIGQRKNVNQESRIMNQGEAKQPLYVVGFDLAENELIVGEDSELFRNEFEIRDACWISPEIESRIKNQESWEIKVKIRHRAPEVSCLIKPIIHNSRFMIQLNESVRAVTPGQSAVFYHCDEVIGGGIIC